MSKSVKEQVKLCKNCKKPFTNRKKWASRGVWDQVLYCSKRCRTEAKAAKARTRT